MKVVFVASSLGRGGAERQLVSLARGLGELGHQVSLLLFYGQGELEAELAGSAVAVEILEKRGRWDLARFGHRLVRRLRSLRPDVIHGFLVVPNVLVALAAPFVPRVRVVWGVRAADQDLSQYGWASRWSFRVSRMLAGRADLILVNSTAGLRHHASLGYPPDRMHVVSNGIDIGRFRPDPVGRRIVREGWGVEPGTPVVGLVARVDPVKGHRTFLKAIALLRRARPDVVAVCVGGGDEPLAAELRREAESLGLAAAVRWTGSASDLAPVYSAFDALCLASISEGFPNVVAEAMACGVPCAVTDVGDAAMLVGDTGVVVGIGDAEAMANGIDRLLGGQDPDRPARCRDRITQRFSVATMVRATAAELENLL